MVASRLDRASFEADELDRNIDLFLQQNKEQLAVAAQSRYNTFKQLADSYQQQFAAQESEYQKLLDAKLKLEAKLTEIRQQRVELQAKLELAKSKETTHKAVESVGDVSVVTDGLGAMGEQIEKRLDKATAQAEIDASRLETQMSEVLEEHAIKTQIEERRRRLGLSS